MKRRIGLYERRAKADDRMLWINPAENQRVRFLIEYVDDDDDDDDDEFLHSCWTIIAGYRRWPRRKESQTGGAGLDKSKCYDAALEDLEHAKKCYMTSIRFCHCH
jgi:hypothetical protein